MYNIPSQLIENCKELLQEKQVVELNKSKYYLEDVTNEFSEEGRPYLKLVKVRGTETQYIPISFKGSFDKISGFTNEQLEVLEQIRKLVKEVDDEVDREKLEKEKLNQLEKEKKKALYEGKVAEILELGKDVASDYEMKMINRWYWPYGYSEQNAALRQADAVLDMFKERQEKKRQEVERKENALTIDILDVFDERDKEISLKEWFDLYMRAVESGDFRNDYERRAIVANGVLYCNASRAIKANNVGSIDSKTGERTGKEGNQLYKAAINGEEWQGIYSRLALPDEIDAWLIKKYDEEWIKYKEQH